MPNKNNWVFTIFDYTDDQEMCMKTFMETHEWALKYIEYGHELTKEGTPHLQGFLSTEERISKDGVLNNLARMFANRTKDGITIRACEGGAWSNATYVTKERDDIVKYGKCPVMSTPQTMNENKKRKAEEIIRLSKERKLNELERDYPSEYIQRYSTIQKISQELPEVTQWLDEPPAILIYGESGVGKSYYARKTYPNLYIKSKERFDSWDNYYGQENVLIEDVTPMFIRQWYEMLLVVLDIYPFSAKRLFGQLPGIRPKNIIFTSMYTLDELILSCPKPEAMKRRFKEIKNKIKDF